MELHRQLSVAGTTSMAHVLFKCPRLHQGEPGMKRPMSCDNFSHVEALEPHVSDSLMGIQPGGQQRRYRHRTACRPPGSNMMWQAGRQHAAPAPLCASCALAVVVAPALPSPLPACLPAHPPTWDAHSVTGRAQTSHTSLRSWIVSYQRPLLASWFCSPIAKGILLKEHCSSRKKSGSREQRAFKTHGVAPDIAHIARGRPASSD